MKTKLRVYHNIGKCYLNLHSIVYTVRGSPSSIWHTVGSNDANADGKTISIVSAGNCTILYSTFIKDKNGRELWQGDVVTTNGINPRVITWDRFAWFLQDLRDPSRKEFIDASGHAHKYIESMYGEFNKVEEEEIYEMK